MPPISIYESDTDNAPRTVDLSWQELRELLAAPRVAPCAPCVVDLSPEAQLERREKQCTHKNGPAWSPHVLREGATRSNAAVESLSYLVIDVDHASGAQAVQLAAKLDGYDCVVHSTHSHRARVAESRRATPLGQALPAEDVCLRIVFALTRSIRAAEFPTVWRASLDALGLDLADEQCKDLQRLYFLPSVTAAREREFVYLELAGAPLDVDLLLSHARVALRPPSPTPMPHADLDCADMPEPASVDLQVLRDRLKEVRRRKARRGDEKYELLDRIVRGKVFCVPGTDPGTAAEWRARGIEKGRQMAVHRAASLVAFALPAMTPTAAALELLRPCLEQSDTAPEGIGYWLDKCAESYDVAMTHRIERDLERRRIDDALRLSFAGLAGKPGAMRQLAGEIALRAEQAGGKGDDPIADAAAEQVDPLRNWRDLLLTKADGVSLKQYGANAYTILALDENVRGTLSFDVVEKMVVVAGGPFHGTPATVLPSEVVDWLVRQYDLHLPEATVEQRILRVAIDNQVDPLREWLEALVWDGTSRLEDMLISYGRAHVKSLEGVDIGKYVRDVTRKTMVGAVARALEPGCQMDTMLVLEGPMQGEGKTSFCRILGGRWAATTTLVLGDKDTSQLVSTAWITELGELRSLHSTDMDAAKSFLTLMEDRFRVPWGRVPERFPRRAVFFGTTNKDTYLKDTRNRRIWPVRVGDFDLDALRRDRDQLWAEAVHLYRMYCAERDRGIKGDANPFKWWFARGEQRVADEQAAERVESTHFELKIAEWWSGCRKRPAQVTTSQVAEEVLRLTTDRVTHAVQTEVGIAMRRLGFVKARGMLHGHKQWYYEPTEALLELPVGARPQAMALVANSQPHGARR